MANSNLPSLPSSKVANAAAVAANASADVARAAITRWFESNNIWHLTPDTIQTCIYHLPEVLAYVADAEGELLLYRHWIIAVHTGDQIKKAYIKFGEV